MVKQKNEKDLANLLNSNCIPLQREICKVLGLPDSLDLSNKTIQFYSFPPDLGNLLSKIIITQLHLIKKKSLTSQVYFKNLLNSS